MVTLTRGLNGHFVVNSTRSADQEAPAVTGLPGGGFVVTWVDKGTTGADSSGGSIKGQLFDSVGEPVGGEFLVNSTTAGVQRSPVVTPLSSGFVAAWQDLSQTGGDTSGGAIRAQMFDLDGAKVGTEFLVNTTSAGSQSQPALLALPGGGFLVAFADSSAGSASGAIIRTQLFDASGVKVGAERIVTDTTDFKEVGSLTQLSTGAIVITYARVHPVGDGSFTSGPVMARILDAAGQPAGAEFVVSDSAVPDQLDPTVTALEGGRFVVVWSDYNGTGDGSASSVHGQIFDSSGAAVGAEFRVNTGEPTGEQNFPGVQSVPGGGFVAVWADQAITPGIRAQLFSATGEAVGDPVTVSHGYGQFAATLSMISPTELAVAWTDTRDTSEGRNISVQVMVLGTATARPDSFTTDEATAVSGSVFQNSGGYDDDPAGAPLQVAAVNGSSAAVGQQIQLASGALLKLNADGSFSYDPNHAFDSLNAAAEGGVTSALDSFTYRLVGGSTAKTTITVNGIGGAASNDFSGTAADDSASGNSVANLFRFEQGGNDTLSGLEGDDRFYFGAAFAAGDQVNGGVGTDQLLLQGSYSLTITRAMLDAVERIVLLSSQDSAFVPAAAGPYVYALTTQSGLVPPGQTLIVDGSGLGAGESLHFDGSAETGGTFDLRGGAAADTLIGGGLSDTLTGGAANDVLEGGIGNDTMSGGLGDDVYISDHNGDLIVEAANGGVDEVRSSAQNYGIHAYANVENLTGTSNTGQWLSGNSLNNVIRGGAGNDIINAAAGADTMIGGLGLDTYVVDNVGDLVIEEADGGLDRTDSDLASYTLTANVEMLIGRLQTGQTLIGNTLDNRIVARDGNDTLDGGIGKDTMLGGLGNDIYFVDNALDVVTEEAGAGTDEVRVSIAAYTLGANLENATGLLATGHSLTGNALVNLLKGGAGNDVLDGAAGADTMNGGAGDDTYHVDDGLDTIQETSGIDTVVTSLSFFALGAPLENLTLTGDGGTAHGNALGNILTGNAGANVLNGFGGADTLIGGGGNDLYRVDTAGDVVTELAEQGTDTVESSVSYTLGANVENLQLLGSDALSGTGNALDNLITGNAGANSLSGGGGNDVLDGGLGADAMAGGAGDDVYHVDQLGDSVGENAGEGTDTVRSAVGFELLANVENLVLTGSASVDGTGNGLANVITGNSGNNVLDGGTGADTMAGGAGNDTYHLDVSGDSVTELAGEGTDSVWAAFSYTLGTHFENLTLTGIGNFDGTGNAFANILNGNSGNNRLDGGLGADTMNGGNGDDVYIVDNAGDRANEINVGGGGTDSVLSSVSFTLGANVENLTLTGTGHINAVGNALANVLTGNSGNNTLTGGAGADTMAGGLGNDVYVVDQAGDTVTESASAGIDRVESAIDYTLGSQVENLTLTGTAVTGTGNSHNNVIVGNDVANVLSGAAGADTLDGKAGADSMNGGLGNDIYVVDDGGDAVTEASGQGTDTVQSFISYALGANVEVLTLVGTADVNGTGNALSNVLNGNAGANVLDGGAGADQMFGGLGNDTYIVAHVGDKATETSAVGGDDHVLAGISFQLGANIERLTLTGTGNINGFGNASSNVMTGNAGNNTLSGGAGVDTMTGGAGHDIYYVDVAGDVVTELAGEGTDTVNSSIAYTLGANLENLTLTGSAALSGTGNALNNVLTGNAGANALSGGAGNDTLVGGAGADTLTGGEGDDIYVIDSLDTLVEAAGGGIDTVQTSQSYTLLAEFEYLTLTGSLNVNGTGNALNNVLNGNAGNNTLDGGAGADNMFGGLGNDIYIVDNAVDRVFETSATGGTDTVHSAVSFTLGANLENLTLTGGAAVNAIGNDLANVINGNSGENVIAGGLGADTLSGGAGNDSFSYGAVAHSTAASRDTVHGFTSGDKINLSQIDAVAATAGTNDAFTFIGSGAFTNVAGQLRAYQSGPEWIVEGDVNGDGTADLVIGVATANPAILAADFVL